MYPAAPEVLTLKTNLAESPTSVALKDGRVTSKLVTLDICGPKQAMQGFKPMLRENAFDIGELAIITYLQAKMYGKPFVMLPFAVNGQAHHGAMGYNKEFGVLTPKDLEGKKVGVRTYAQTTGLWFRGILSREYGVDLSKITWLTTGGSHLAEFKDPANCQVIPPDSNLGDMLLNGQIAAGLLGKDLPADPRIELIVPNAKEAAAAWIKREGLIPINHVFVVHKDLSKQRPDVVREIYRMLIEARSFAPESVTAGLPPYGFNAIRKTLEMAIDLALEQKLIDRRFTPEELFDETTIAL
jgi:4,5-dihydroxyphthalate decarboxylase